MNNKAKNKGYFSDSVSNGVPGQDGYNGKMLKRAYDKLPHGAVRLAAIQSAMQQADLNKDLYHQMLFRYDFGYEVTFHDDGAKILPCCMELIALCDQNPQIEFPDLYPLMLLEWTISTCSGLPQIPVAQIEGLLEEYRKRCEHSGVTLRTYYWESCRFFVPIDREKALGFFQQFLNEPRDFFSDCKACEQDNMVWIYLELLNDFERAWDLAKPIFEQTLTCHEVPHGTYDSFLCWHLENGDLENAQKMAQELYAIAKNKKPYLSHMGNLLWFYAKTDLEKGVSVFQSHLLFAIDLLDEDTLFCFYSGMDALFQALAKDGREQIKLILPQQFEEYRADGVYQVKTLAEYAHERAKKIAQRFDLRNGSDYYAKKLALISG